MLIIWSIDRLSRGGIGQIFSLVHSFQQLGVQVVSCKETWLDSAGPAGELLLAVVAWVSAFESQRKSERVRAGQARAIREGKLLGRPKGAKDKNRRRRAGYLSRWINKSPGGVKAMASISDRGGK